MQLQVEENSASGTLVTDQITAQDPDTTAELEFTIDWTATYATNKGVRVEDTEIYNEYVLIFKKVELGCL